jgi:CheY-like chemotaxis protein
MNTNNPVILLAEDDENDVFFMQRALQKAGVSSQLQVVADGQQTIDYLQGKDKFADRDQHPLPSLLLLDLKMPFMNGFDVLAWMRSQANLQELPVVVLTSSNEERDRQRAKELGARGYFVKPPTREMVAELIQFLGERSVVPTSSV